MSKKKTQPTEHPAETPHADVAAVLERKGKTPNPEKAARPEKTREPKPKEGPLVVFAFRLTPEERDLIHKAAGPARASRFVRTVAIAAAAEDESAIRTAIREAKEARS